jgi:hypothetical protein
LEMLNPYPALHEQFDCADDPATDHELCLQVVQSDARPAAMVVEYDPARQRTHTCEPGTTLYVPAEQAEQFDPFAPINPALQEH